jgi:hypothetical protein
MTAIDTKHKSLKISIIILVLLSTTSYKVFSQIFNGGQNPPSVKFNQINTTHFQIIYPTPLEDEAQRMANVLEKIIDDVAKSLGRAPRPISIILQNQGVESNGFVQTAPRRSEFYTIPAQEFDAQDWLNGLAVHELRHVVQFDKLVPHLNAPLFEELKLTLFGMNLPPWFFEGDAVAIETLLSPAGRGRQPSFEMVFKANLLSGRNYSYSKNYIGSYKDFTPGYYSLGYFMTAKIRRDFGASILDQSLKHISKFPIRPYGFSTALKKFGGYGTHQLYKKTTEEIDSLWREQSEKSNFQTYEYKNPDHDLTPINYLLPQHTIDGKIIYLKSSKSKRPTFMIFDGNKEEKLLEIGNQTEANFNYSNDLLVWDEYRPDPRFEKRSYNVICTYNLKTKTYKQLTSKSRYFSPIFSGDGKKILAVKVSYSNKFEIVKLDAETGEELHSYPNEKNYVLQNPRFNLKENQIIVTALNQEGKTLLLYDLINQSEKILFPPLRQLISKPVFWNDNIILKAHYNGIDNIYSFDLKTEKINQITEARFGAFNPNVFPNSNKLLFNDYQANGYQVAEIDLSLPESQTPLTADNYFVEYFEPLIAQENTSDVFQNIPDNIYTAKPYKEISDLFYFHSLRPLAEVNDFDNDYKIGFDLVSNNKLNTLAATVGYQFNSALNSNEFSAALSYSKFYPILSSSIKDRARLAYAKQTQNNIPITIPFEWRETEIKLNALVPFFSSWLNKNMYSGFEVSTYYINRYQLTAKPNNFLTSIKFPLDYSLFWSYYTKRSAQDLASPWGINLRLKYQHLPFDPAITGNNLILKSYFYLPGVISNHSFQVSYNWQKNNGFYQYHSDIARASGYAHLNPLNKLENSFFMSYKFPIAYPDWEIGPLAYIKRIKGGFFTDFENLGTDGGLRSYGAEIRADLNLLRFYLPNFDAGTKIIIPAEKNITKKPIFEFGLFFNY